MSKVKQQVNPNVLVVGAEVVWRRTGYSGQKYTIQLVFPNGRVRLKADMIVGMDEVMSADRSKYTSVKCLNNIPFKECSCEECNKERRAGRI